MPSRNFIVPSIFLFLLVLACNSDTADATNKESNSKYYSELPFNENLLEEGDIILRRGSGMLSNYIIKKLNDSLPVSHCGIITKKDNEIVVIHSILSEEKGIKGITSEPINDFIAEGLLNTLVIVRPKQTKQFKKEFVEKAHILLSKNIPFDPMFDINSSDKMYCTEIVWKISKDLLGKDIFHKKVPANNTELLGFDSFFNPAYFEVIFSDFE